MSRRRIAWYEYLERFRACSMRRRFTLCSCKYGVSQGFDGRDEIAFVMSGACLSRRLERVEFDQIRQAGWWLCNERFR